MEHLDIGIRMKDYENVSSHFLTKRTPVIIRVDGKTFHTISKKYFDKGYDEEFVTLMRETTAYLQSQIQSCDFAYVQSDEISLLLTDYKTIRTQGWFNYEINKMISVSAALASSYFSYAFGKIVQFDSRCFNIPKEEVCNYFIWRQLDATRNAIQMAGREHFSHKEMNKLNCAQIQEKLFKEKGINFNDFSPDRKRGSCIVEGVEDRNIPLFTKDRNYIEKYVFLSEV